MDSSSSGPATQDTASPDPGQDIDLAGRTIGDFRIRRRLGQGGMGQVYLAEQISLGREVALKILRPELAGNKTSLERFKAEATAVAKATHANIVQIYTIQEAALDNQLVHCIALEYVEGRNLREYLEKKGTPDILVGLSIMRQVASALQRASELGIIHRDIKPENILINRRGEVKVADFGLTYDPNRPVNLTQSGVTMGTPLYMSPEQVEARPIDPRTDIYSFGVTCYHMFAGNPPFKGNSPFEVALQHVQKEPTPLQEIRPDLPPELCFLIHKMMAKKSEERPQTAREVVREVVRLRDTLVGATSLGMSLSSFSLGSGEMPSVSTQSLPGYRPSPKWLHVVGALGVMLALAGGLWWSYWGHLQAVAPSPVDEAARPADTFKEREKELLKLVQEHMNPENRLDLHAGLKHSLELGLLYLRQLRLDDADDFFNKIAQQKGYGTVGKTGSAIVLALRGEADKSNQKFVTTLVEKNVKNQDLRNIWRNYPPWREMIARALHHNKVNSPATFPTELEPWLNPPRPSPRAAS